MNKIQQNTRNIKINRLLLAIVAALLIANIIQTRHTLDDCSDDLYNHLTKKINTIQKG